MIRGSSVVRGTSALRFGSQEGSREDGQRVFCESWHSQEPSGESCSGSEMNAVTIMGLKHMSKTLSGGCSTLGYILSSNTLHQMFHFVKSKRETRQSEACWVE